MVTNRKVTGKASSMPGGLALSGAVSMGITLLLAIVTAKLVDMGTLPEGGIGYAALGILMLSSAVGALTAVARIKRQRLAVCLGSGLIYYILLLSLTALFFGGQYTGMGVTALAVAGGCGSVILLGMGEGRRRKRPVRSARHR